MAAFAAARLKLGVDPLGGAGVDYWPRIAEQYRLDLTIVNPHVDPTFRFMTARLGRPDPHGLLLPYAMASLIAHEGQFDVAFGNDTDPDRHGIVTRTAGLLNPNHYLAAAIHYLFTAPAGLAGRSRQSAKRWSVSSHHRPRGATAWAAPAGGAGRLQVVRATA